MSCDQHRYKQNGNETATYKHTRCLTLTAGRSFNKFNDKVLNKIPFSSWSSVITDCPRTTDLFQYYAAPQRYCRLRKSNHSTTAPNWAMGENLGVSSKH